MEGTTPARTLTSAFTTRTMNALSLSGIQSHPFKRFIHHILSRFDLASTKHYFLISFVIPASLWVVSCSCLVSSNKVKVFTSLVSSKDMIFQILRISETTGQMRLSCRRRSVSPSDDIIGIQVDLAESDSEDMSDPQVRERVCKRRMAVVMMD